MAKIYTKTGDKGLTSLGTGELVAKADLRVEAYGTIDELSSFMGLAVSELEEGKVRSELIWIQKKLFVITSLLAFPGQVEPASFGEVAEEDLKKLEQSIDTMTAEIPALTSFILPGGSKAGSLLHCNRSICRRAERQLTKLDFAEYPLGVQVLPFINRLSDYLFIAARFVNYQNGSFELGAK